MTREDSVGRYDKAVEKQKEDLIEEIKKGIENAKKLNPDIEEVRFKLYENNDRAYKIVFLFFNENAEMQFIDKKNKRQTRLEITDLTKYLLLKADDIKGIVLEEISDNYIDQSLLGKSVFQEIIRLNNLHKDNLFYYTTESQLILWTEEDSNLRKSGGGGLYTEEQRLICEALGIEEKHKTVAKNHEKSKKTLLELVKERLGNAIDNGVEPEEVTVKYNKITGGFEGITLKGKHENPRSGYRKIIDKRDIKKITAYGTDQDAISVDKIDGVIEYLEDQKITIKYSNPPTKKVKETSSIPLENDNERGK